MDPVVRMTGALDPRGAWAADRCSIAGTLGVVGTRSAFLLLREAFYGARPLGHLSAPGRGDEPGGGEPVAAARLRELVEAGLLEREDYREAGQRTRKAYRLTDKGADLFPVLVAL